MNFTFLGNRIFNDIIELIGDYCGEKGGSFNMTGTVIRIGKFGQRYTGRNHVKNEAETEAKHL